MLLYYINISMMYSRPGIEPLQVWIHQGKFYPDLNKCPICQDTMPFGWQSARLVSYVLLQSCISLLLLGIQYRHLLKQHIPMRMVTNCQEHLLKFQLAKLGLTEVELCFTLQNFIFRRGLKAA